MNLGIVLLFHLLSLRNHGFPRHAPPCALQRPVRRTTSPRLGRLEDGGATLRRNFRRPKLRYACNVLGVNRRPVRPSVEVFATPPPDVAPRTQFVERETRRRVSRTNRAIQQLGQMSVTRSIRALFSLILFVRASFFQNYDYSTEPRRVPIAEETLQRGERDDVLGSAFEAGRVEPRRDDRSWTCFRGRRAWDRQSSSAADQDVAGPLGRLAHWPSGPTTFSLSPTSPAPRFMPWRCETRTCRRRQGWNWETSTTSRTST